MIVLRLMIATTSVVLLACASSPVSDPAQAQLAERISDSGAHYAPAAEWRAAQPAALGLDPARVDALKRDVSGGRYGSIQGLVVVRYGYVGIEQYNGWAKETAHTMQSVTKSVTSLMFGILRAQLSAADGRLDRPVLDVFSRYQPVSNDGGAKRALTLRHLLTMRANMDFWEQPYDGSPLDQLNRSAGDWIQFVLDRRMTGDPGTDWAYNSGAAILMGGVIRELSHTEVDSFARRELFAPLGIVGERWAKSPYDGLPHCGGGLNLRATDLARIGYLVLRRGRWADRQIVPESWIDESTKPYSTGSNLIFSDFHSSYGYFWWLFPRRRGGFDASIIAASGSGGQWLFVVPDLDLVVAVIATNGDGLDLLYDQILPAIASPPV